MAKKKAKEKYYYVLGNGHRYEVTGSNGKFIFCGDTQFRRSADRGRFVTESVAEVAAKEAEKEETEE